MLASCPAQAMAAGLLTPINERYLMVRTSSAPPQGAFCCPWSIRSYLTPAANHSRHQNFWQIPSPWPSSLAAFHRKGACLTFEFNPPNLPQARHRERPPGELP